MLRPVLLSRKFLTLLVFGGLFLLFNPSPSQAATGCDCATMSSLLKSAAQTIVSGVVNPIILAIEKAAGYQAAMNRQDLTAIREAIILAQERTTEAIELADLSQANRLTERTYEPASQPPTNCLNDILGEAWRSSATVKDAVRDNLLLATAQRSAKSAKPADYLKEINAGTLKTENLTRLLGVAPEALTLTPAEFNLASEALGQLTDPLPAPALPAEMANATAGRLYAAGKSDLEKRLAIYQGILAQRLVSRAPTIAGLSDWSERKWQEMGGSGSPPGLVEGYLSENSLTWLLTNLRLGSANWHEKVLPALPEAGLLREMAAMTAIQLELSRRQNVHLENLSLLLALDGLDRLDQRARPALRNQYRLALSGR
jgi:hypothetical protein